MLGAWWIGPGSWRVGRRRCGLWRAGRRHGDGEGGRIGFGMRIGSGVCVARRGCGLRGCWLGCRRLVWGVGGVVGGGIALLFGLID